MGQRSTHPWLLPCHTVTEFFSEWCSTSLMILQASELSLFHCLFPDRGNPVHLTVSQLLVVFAYTAVFTDPLRSLHKSNSSHSWRVLALCMGQSVTPVVLGKATSTSIKAFCQAKRRARTLATGVAQHIQAQYRHKSYLPASHHAKNFYKIVLAVLGSSTEKVKTIPSSSYHQSLKKEYITYNISHINEKWLRLNFRKCVSHSHHGQKNPVWT